MVVFREAEVDGHEEHGISRREVLRRGGTILGGAALAWTTPVVNTVGMSRALAADPSPAESGLSFIALNVKCGSNKFVVKWEDNGTAAGAWDPEPSSFPGCTSTDFQPTGTKADGGTLGLSASVNGDGSVTISVPSGCTVSSSAGKAGGPPGTDECCPGPSGGGALTFHPCT